jgi:hypothetical protein
MYPIATQSDKSDGRAGIHCPHDLAGIHDGARVWANPPKARNNNGRLISRITNFFAEDSAKPGCSL